MKVTSFVLPAILVALGFSTTQAGLFDVNLLERLGLRARKPVAECGPQVSDSGVGDPLSHRREVVKQPCEPTLHTYQRQVARPLSPDSKRRAKPIAECKTAEEAAESAQRITAQKIARLIFQSQTGCYAKDRRAAIHRLGDRFDCSQNPEILVAFVYALNDADESVRAKAADEIGDQIGRHPDCAVPEVVAALKVALGDCDGAVKREVRQALASCGIDVVRGRKGDCARPAEKCVTTAAVVPGTDADTKSPIEQTAAVVPVESDEPAAREWFPGLTMCVKSLKQSRPIVTLQKMFSVR